MEKDSFPDGRLPVPPQAYRLRLWIGYIGFIPAVAGQFKSILLKGLYTKGAMTYLDVVYNYASLPGENELRAIDSMREVYGIRSVNFNEKDKTVRVEFDASRLKQDAVARMLRQAGIDVREPVALASPR